MGKEENNNKKKIVNIKTIVGILLVLIAVALFLLLRGRTTVIGEYPNDIRNTALICSNVGDSYPFFTYDNSTKKETKISMIFRDDELETISLTHTLHYNDGVKSTGSEAHNHAAMNISFGKDGLGTDALSATYSRLDDRMTMSLYSSAAKLDNRSVKYFLIDDYSILSAGMPSATAKINYEEKGFSCTISE